MNLVKWFQGLARNARSYQRRKGVATRLGLNDVGRGMARSCFVVSHNWFPVTCLKNTVARAQSVPRHNRVPRILAKAISPLAPASSYSRVLPSIPALFISLFGCLSRAQWIGLLAYFRSALYDGQLQISSTNPVDAAPSPESKFGSSFRRQVSSYSRFRSLDVGALCFAVSSTSIYS